MTNKYRVQVRRDEKGYLWARLFKDGVQIDEEYGDHGMGEDIGGEYCAEFFFHDETVPVGTHGNYVFITVMDRDYDGEEIDCEIRLLKQEEGSFDDATKSVPVPCVFVA